MKESEIINDEIPAYVVNHLQLPEKLVELIRMGKWSLPKGQEMFKELFKGTMEKQHIYGLLYPLELMKSETEHLVKNEKNPDMIIAFLGQKDNKYDPGDIELSKIVLIGDLGLGSDQPIALDYRLRENNPRVITLLWRSREEGNRWICVSENFNKFIEDIGLENEKDIDL